MPDETTSPPTSSGTPTKAKGWQPPSTEELQQLLPQYEITALLGRGGMGAVYKGTQKNLDRPVAIKILPPDMEDSDGANYAERFKNEARAMAKLNHPGIVGVYDFGETTDGLLYIVMEFIEGTDVSRMIAKQGRLPTEHAMAITAHVCDALQYAHERSIIHRDIKPANIMVGYDGVVKVADFGLAKMSQSGESGLTRSGMAMGTLHYMAPEALMLGTSVDHRADVYAVGVMLYQMLTGKLPQGMFDPPSLQVPGLDPRFDQVIAKAIRDDRDSRYQSASAMRADLDGILTQPVIKVESSAEKAPAALPTKARPQRPAVPTYRPPSSPHLARAHRSSGLPSWLMLCFFTVLLGVGCYWVKLRAPEQLIQIFKPSSQQAPLPDVPAGPWFETFPAALTHLTRYAPGGGGYLGKAPDTAMRLDPTTLVITNDKDTRGSYYITFNDTVRVEGSFEAELKLKSTASTCVCLLYVPVGSRYLRLQLDLWRKTLLSPVTPEIHTLPVMTDGRQHRLNLRAITEPTPPGEPAQTAIYLQIDDGEVFRWTGIEAALAEVDLSHKLTPRPQLLSFGFDLEKKSVFAISSYRLRSLGGTVSVTPKLNGPQPGQSRPLLAPTEIDKLKRLVIQALTAMRLDDTTCIYEISPTGLISLEIKDPTVGDLAPLSELPICKFKVNNSRALSELSAIAGPELEDLWVMGCKQLISLVPLANCNRLHHLQFAGCPITDLAPLKNLPVVYLGFADTGVTDITPLSGLPLERVYFENTAITDVSPLASCPTIEIIGLSKVASNPETLRQLPKLQYISSTYNFKTQRPSQTAAEFWASLPAPTPKPPAVTIWTDTKGRSLQALFKAIEGDKVILEIEGKTQEVPMSTLSATSQQQARDLNLQRSQD